MGLPETRRFEAERELGEFCKNRIPKHLSSKIRYVFKVREDSVVLSEERPWYRDPSEWITAPVVRFLYSHDTNTWSLYWRRANERWSHCDWFEPVARFREALQEVVEDRHGTFFG